jgi:hypothetical protein
LDKVATVSSQTNLCVQDLKVLKTKLSEYVRLAAGRETVLVTDRDRVVADSQVTAPFLWMRCLTLRDLKIDTGPAIGPRGPVIYLDSSVALAHLLAEGRR